MDPSLGGAPRAGAWLGRYQLREELGRGGFATVYRAWDSRLDREVAVKVLTPGASPKALERFDREVKAAARLRHPAVVAVHDVGTVGAVPYLVMDLVPGRPFDAFCADPDVRLGQKVEVVAEVARAVQAAHDQGVLHRDLKPENVLVDPEGRPHVLDFGLALLVDGPERARLTRPGTMLGTPSYMAPEAMLGRATDPRTDVYGLGGLLYHALTGQPPIEPDSWPVGVVDVAPRPPRKLRPGVPRALERVALRCLEKDQGARYRSAGEVAEALAAAGPVGRSPRPRPSSAPDAGPGPARIALLAALFFLAAAGGAWLALRGPPAEDGPASAGPAVGAASPTPASPTPATSPSPPPAPSPTPLALWTRWDVGRGPLYRYRQVRTVRRGEQSAGFEIGWTWRLDVDEVLPGRVRCPAEFRAIRVAVSQPGLPPLSYDTTGPPGAQAPVLSALGDFVGARATVELDPRSGDCLGIDGITALARQVGQAQPMVQALASTFTDDLVAGTMDLLCHHLPREPAEVGDAWERPVEVHVNATGPGARRLTLERREPAGEARIRWRLVEPPRWPAGVAGPRVEAHGSSRWADGRLVEAEAVRVISGGGSRQEDRFRLELIE